MYLDGVRAADWARHCGIITTTQDCCLLGLTLKNVKMTRKNLNYQSQPGIARNCLIRFSVAKGLSSLNPELSADNGSGQNKSGSGPRVHSAAH